jgi:hypothetical protein
VKEKNRNYKRKGGKRKVHKIIKEKLKEIQR